MDFQVVMPSSFKFVVVCLGFNNDFNLKRNYHLSKILY